MSAAGPLSLRGDSLRSSARPSAGESVHGYTPELPAAHAAAHRPPAGQPRRAGAEEGAAWALPPRPGQAAAPDRPCEARLRDMLHSRAFHVRGTFRALDAENTGSVPLSQLRERLVALYNLGDQPQYVAALQHILQSASVDGSGMIQFKELAAALRGSGAARGEGACAAEGAPPRRPRTAQPPRAPAAPSSRPSTAASRPPAPPDARPAIPRARSASRLRRLHNALQEERGLFEQVQNQVAELEGRRRDLAGRLADADGSAGALTAPSPGRSSGGPPADTLGRSLSPLQFLRPHPAQPYCCPAGRSSRRTAFARNHLGGVVIGADRGCEFQERMDQRDSIRRAVDLESVRATPAAAAPGADDSQPGALPWRSFLNGSSSRGAGARRRTPLQPYRMTAAGIPSVLPICAFERQSCSRSRAYRDYAGRRILVDLMDPPRIRAVTDANDTR